MAKKSKKSKLAKKPAAKRRPASKAKAKSAAPGRVGTGPGPGPAEIGRDLVALFNAGKMDAPCKKWWSDKIESVEGDGQVWRGRKACEGKNAWWYSMFEALGASAEGPYVGGTGFAVKFDSHVREKATGKEMRGTEIGFYTVKNGKIIREEFLNRV